MSKDILKKSKKNKKSEKQNYLKKIQEYHLVLWLLLCFPVGLYKSYRHKILPRWLNTLFTIIFIICMIAIIDTIINPTRIVDNKIKKEIQTYEIGKIYTLEQYNSIDNMYYVYDLITSTGRYDVYFTSDFKIHAIKQIDRIHKDIYINEDFLYKNIYSEIIQYLDFDSNFRLDAYEIVAEDNNMQILKIDNTEYTFLISMESVSLVYNNESIFYENSLPSIKMPQKIFKKVAKKFPQTKEYWYTNMIDFTDEYYMLCFITKDGNMYQLLIYEDGKIRVNVATGNINSYDEDKLQEYFEFIKETN